MNAIGTSAWSETKNGTPEVLNRPSEFPTETGERSVNEDAQRFHNLGAPVRAIDPEHNALVYSLHRGGAFFEVFSQSGQIRTTELLDHEFTPTAIVEIGATDGKDGNDQPDNKTDDFITLTVTINDVNEPPRVTGLRSLWVIENHEGVLYTYQASDPEEDTISWSVAGTDRADFAIDGGKLEFLNPPDFELPADADEDNLYDIEVRVSDGRFSDATQVNILVQNQNERPTITGPTSRTLAENGSADVATYVGTDSEGNSIDYEVEGTDYNDFEIDDPTGILTFRTAPDYENPRDANRDNACEIEVCAYDVLGGPCLDVTVTVTNVNEVPTGVPHH